MRPVLLAQEQHDFRQAMRSFCEDKIAPNAAHVDETGEYPWDNFKACVELELPGLGIPTVSAGPGPTTSPRRS